MNALILAAGKGTRMAPYTDTMPKALVPVNGHPMIEIVIQRLIHAGFNNIVINIHHFGQQIIDYIRLNHNFGINIRFSDERELLLDTGGGIKKASFLFKDQPFLIHNTDILSNINLQDLWQYHINSGTIATLAVKNRPTSRSLLINKDNFLSGWKNNITGQTRISRETIETLRPIAFSAIHVVSPSLIEKINETGVFSIIDTYLRLAKSHLISTWNHDSDIWADLGTPEHIQEAVKKYGNDLLA